MRLAVLNAHVPFEHGGAERLAEGLIAALTGEGHEVDLLRIPVQEGPDGIVDSIISSRLIDLDKSHSGKIDAVIALKFPPYLVRHSTKIIWVIHQFRAVYDQWQHPLGGYARNPRGALVREAVLAADRQAFSEARAVYAISRTVSRRLETFNRVAAPPILTPPAHAEMFRSGTAEDFLYFPSRLTHMKRQDLAIRAMAATRNNVKLVIAGAAADAPYGERLRSLVAELRLGDRVKFLGSVPFEKHVDLYARCFGVLFCPLEEDYGYVTLEGMLASKPIITVSDAGEPTQFVNDSGAGVVSDSDVQSLANAIDGLCDNRDRAAQMGRMGREFYGDQDISWKSAVRKLLA